MAKPTLIFVYNADSGFFNLIADVAHKIFSPSTYPCNLCKLTHSHFRMLNEWRNFLEGLQYPLVFLHRDQFLKEYGDQKIPLPAILKLDENNKLETVLSRDVISSARNLPELERELTSKLAA